MTFSEILNKYIELIGCTGKELADLSGIAAPVISGYKKGTRTPKYGSDQLESLIKALSTLASKKSVNELNEAIIRDGLESTLEKEDVDFETFRNNFNMLITTLKINVSDLSKYMGFDSSYISKIRSGVRKPLNIKVFADAVSKFTTYNYLNVNGGVLKDLIKCTPEHLSDENLFYNDLYFWLTNNKHVEEDNYKIDNFIFKLDEFDLNEYIRAIKFDKLFTPTLPKLKTRSKIYYGLDGYKEAQLDVLRQAAFYKSKEDIFWYSNMPMIEASKDLKFTKKFMMYLAFILKKGIKLNMVHDLDRPFKELMLGLEGWIPLYMTGQINPYYYKNNSNFLYSIIECVSGNGILHGECVTGNIQKSKLLVSCKKDDIDYYSDNAKLLFKKATPLMNIYTADKEKEFNEIIENNVKIKRDRKNILLSLPVYTLSDDLLNKMLEHSGLSASEKDAIHKWIMKEKEDVNSILKSSRILDEIAVLDAKEFKESGATLDLSKYFFDKKIEYTYEEYIEHIKLLKEFKKIHKNYDYRVSKSTFKNININIINEKQVIISKTNSPITHFVIYHPTLINAIENFKVPIIEKDYIPEKEI